MIARLVLAWCRLRHGPWTVVEHRAEATAWRCATCYRLRGVTVYGPRPRPKTERPGGTQGVARPVSTEATLAKVNP